MGIVGEVRKELTEHIIPFWDKLRDDENGGFYGFMGYDLKLDKNAEKGVILHSRILWFYSNCYLVLGDTKCLENARHCFDFMRKYCVDPVNGGVYWLMNADGSVSDSMKHTYCQAFFIYALASYYDASKDGNALKLALELFETVEKNCTDETAYLEAMSADWKLIPNDALSENGLMADKTMNTTLHLLEAYTELYRVSSDERVLNRLKFQIRIFLDKIYYKPENRLLVFFDRGLNVIGDIHSYGHDIEATWLIDRACEVIGDEALTAEVRKMNAAVVQNIADIAFENGALNNERDKDKISKMHIWWVQAEGVVGFLNGWQKYGIKRYLDISEALWNNIKNEIIDKREGGEWYSQILENGMPDSAKATVDPWKCPYHNGRMCLEVIKRSCTEGDIRYRFKKGIGWKACHEENRDIYTAQRSNRGFYQLCEIDKETFDKLGTENGGDPDVLIGEGRHLFQADDDYYTAPYCTVFDEDFMKLAPWSDAYNRADIDIRMSRELTDLAVNLFGSEEKNREYRRKKSEK